MAGSNSFNFHISNHTGNVYSHAGPAPPPPAPTAWDHDNTPSLGRRGKRTSSWLERLAERDSVIEQQSQQLSELAARSAALAAELASTQRKSQSQELHDATVASLTNSLAAQSRGHDAAIIRHCADFTALNLRAGSTERARNRLADEIRQLKWQHARELERLAAEKRELASELDATSVQCQHLRVCLTERDELFVKHRRDANDFKARAHFLAGMVNSFREGREPLALAADFQLVNAAALASPTADGGSDQITSLDPLDDHHGVPPLLRLGMPALDGALGFFGSFTPPLLHTRELVAPRPALSRPTVLYDPEQPALGRAGRCSPPRLVAPAPLLQGLPFDVATVTATLTAIAALLDCTATLPAPVLDGCSGMAGPDRATTTLASLQPSALGGAASPVDPGTAAFLPAPVYPDTPPAAARLVVRPHLSFPHWTPGPGRARSCSPPHWAHLPAPDNGRPGLPVASRNPLPRLRRLRL